MSFQNFITFLKYQKLNRKAFAETYPSLSFHSYSLTGGHSQFSINPATGQIITSSLLDREERANYQLLVVATDGGQPQGLSSSATVSVTVADINDNPPRFHHHPYVTHIPASTAAGLYMLLLKQGIHTVFWITLYIEIRLYDYRKVLLNCPSF